MDFAIEEAHTKSMALEDMRSWFDFILHQISQLSIPSDLRRHAPTHEGDNRARQQSYCEACHINDHSSRRIHKTTG